ncbi:hypothetical protein FUAX_07320 [Fulvitalea axinellae]|uniref:Uncharacterized protein n=1 Tax=Fulvitalea axinellae TaxID=1182444 RepID=A0AAU9CGF4_9BACT|nr:hypothetical protein FUAX_07320 [Fulvitalea axinellae]
MINLTAVASILACDKTNRKFPNLPRSVWKYRTGKFGNLLYEKSQARMLAMAVCTLAGAGVNFYFFSNTLFFLSK